MNPMTGPRSLVLVHSPLVGRLTWESVGVNLLPDRELRRRFVKELPRLPLAYFQEQAPAARAPARSGYVRLSAAYDGAADEAARLGWPVWRLDADHLAMLTRPRLVADAVAEAVAALE